MNRTFFKAARRRKPLPGPTDPLPPINEEEIWSQIQPSTDAKPQTTLDKLLFAYTTLSRQKRPEVVKAPLQHKCSQADCSWIKVFDDWFICKASGNLHVCSPRECKARADVSGVRVPVLHLNKGDAESMWLHQPERYSVCTLTGLVCETVDFVDEEAWKHERPKSGLLHSKADLTKIDKGAKQYDAALTIARKYYGPIGNKQCEQVAQICTRLWYVLHHKAQPIKQICKFEEFCLVVIKDLYEGWNVNTTQHGRLWVVPKATFKMPGQQLNHYNIINVKLIHTTLSRLNPDTLQELHREFAALNWD